MSFPDSFDFFLSEYSTVVKKKILLAVSGGIDSVVLTHLFYKSNLNFAIAHCNFHLRGKESDGDQSFVANLANDLKIKFFTTDFNTEEYVNKHKVSTQIAARELRYEWFDKIKTDHHFDYIATAHHANDQAETILFNLTKGSGIKGIRGILPVRGHIIRPLLFTSKKEIESYATKNQLVWREDNSNSLIKYKRNLIRHKVIPVLENINPAFINHINFTTERLKLTEELLETHIRKFKESYIRLNKFGGISFSMNELHKKATPLLLLNELLKEYGYQYKQVKQLFTDMGKQSGKVYSSHSHELLVDREELILKPIEKEVSVNEFEIHEDVKEINRSYLNLKCDLISFTSSDQISKQKNILTVDASLISFPLTIREWRIGDYFIPFGMRGRKKVSDFLIDQKLNLFDKKTVKVLCSDSKIVWVIGMRADNRFKVSSKTKKIYIVEVI